MTIKIVKPGKSASVDTRRLFGNLADGTVSVVVERNGMTWVYYEGGIYSRSGRPASFEEREEYAKIAAGRAKDSAPTTARFVVSSVGELEVVGSVNVAVTPFVVDFDPDI